MSNFPSIWRSFARPTNLFRVAQLPHGATNHGKKSRTGGSHSRGGNEELPLPIFPLSSESIDLNDAIELDDGFSVPKKRRKINDIHGISGETSPFISPISSFGALRSRKYSISTEHRGLDVSPRSIPFEDGEWTKQWTNQMGETEKMGIRFQSPHPSSRKSIPSPSAREMTAADEEECTLSDHFSHMTFSEDEGLSETSMSFPSYNLGAMDGYQDMNHTSQVQGQIQSQIQIQSQSQGQGQSQSQSQNPTSPAPNAQGYQDSNFLDRTNSQKIRRTFGSMNVFRPPNSVAARAHEQILPYRSQVCVRDREWNKEHIAILANSNRTERSKDLQSLSGDFRTEAKRIAKILIEELHLPSQMKSIKQVEGCGVAGGEKYISNNIFFKVASDSEGLYGGDQHALKVASHELKSVVSMANVAHLRSKSGKKEFSPHFGLTSMIDYCGHRLLATSLLPVSSKTLVYGSNDGGHTVKTDEGHFGEMMQELATSLNLKRHRAGLHQESANLIYGPCDLEGHVGADGEIYILDLARLFPPETPNTSKKGSFLYQLLRPEYVRAYSQPLSSDAFSLFNGDPSHNEEVRQATKHLQQKLIPDVAKELTKEVQSSLGGPLSTDQIERLVLQLHRKGINLRYLGKIYLLVPDPLLKRLALIEMVARVLKNSLKEKLRSAPYTSYNRDQQYRALVVGFFNTVFGEGFESGVLWSVKVPEGLEDSFSFAVTFSVREHMDMNMLFQRLQTLSGVEFFPSQVPSRRTSPFQHSDFKLFLANDKYAYTGMRDQALGLATSAQFPNAVNREQLESIEKLYQDFIQLAPADAEFVFGLARVQIDLATSRPPSAYPDTRPLLRNACDNFETCLKLQPDFEQAAISYLKALVQSLLSQSRWMLGDYGCTLPSNTFHTYWDEHLKEIRRVVQTCSDGVASLPDSGVDLAGEYLRFSDGPLLECLFNLHPQLDVLSLSLRQFLLTKSRDLFERGVKDACGDVEHREGPSFLVQSLIGAGRCCLKLGDLSRGEEVNGWLECGEEHLKKAEEISPNCARADFRLLQSLRKLAQ